MTTIVFYEYAKCGTCKKALKFLANRRYAVDKRDIYTKPPSKAELEEMLRYYNDDFRRLFNTTGNVYQAMGLSAKIDSMTKKEAVDLLASNGRLIRRPFVLLKNTGVVGFREEVWDKLFKKS